jgi:hypothetical protein
MRKDCEICGEYVLCNDNICDDCKLEGHGDEDAQEGEGEEEATEEAKTSHPSCTA